MVFEITEGEGEGGVNRKSGMKLAKSRHVLVGFASNSGDYVET